METGVPLHPALVHLPLGLAMVMPFITAGIFLLMKKNFLNPGAWLIPVILQAVVVIFTFVAIQLGEKDEENVEDIVSEEYIEEHEEAGKIFMLSGVLSLIVLGAGLKSSSFQTAAQAGSIVLLLGSTGTGMYAGKLGGELVYAHGAASAYAVTDGGSGGESQIQNQKEHEGHEEKDND